MRIRKLLRVRFVVDPFTEQEKIMAELTPMMQKYMETKEQYKDCILFYRLGDFYEMFFDDALVASKELEITLTGKSCGLEERAPMCGIPYHAVEGYLSKLVSRGYKVAICEQVEDPKLAKGLVKREVIRVVTPGTNLNVQSLEAGKNNYATTNSCQEFEVYYQPIVDISKPGDFYASRDFSVPEDTVSSADDRPAVFYRIPEYPRAAGAAYVWH